MIWNNNFHTQDWFKQPSARTCSRFCRLRHAVHAFGGWVALAAVLLLGARRGRYNKHGQVVAHPPSSIPFLALGAWILIVGWFGFNVMSAQKLEGISGLVAMRSLMAMAGGTLTAMKLGKNDGFIHNGPLRQPRRGLRRLRHHAPARRLGRRRHRRRAVRLDVHDYPEQMED